MIYGYSDRIAHALAFVAKHGRQPVRLGGEGTAWPVEPGNVALILARHGADEATIVGGVLVSLLNDASPTLRPGLVEKIEQKFGALVLGILEQAAEQRYDARGKPRAWEVCRLDFLAGLAQADTRALEVAAAREIYVCGSMLTDARRLGAEYLSGYAPGGAPALLRWFGEVVETMERHPVGPRPSMLTELRNLATRLSEVIEAE